MGFPVCAEKAVYAVHQCDGFMQADFRIGEELPALICGCNEVTVENIHVQTCMTKCNERMADPSQRGQHLATCAANTYKVNDYRVGCVNEFVCCKMSACHTNRFSVVQSNR